jgi:hypothetical protein
VASDAPVLATASAETQAQLQRDNARLRAQLGRERARHRSALTRTKRQHRRSLERSRRAARRLALKDTGVDHALRLASATYGVSYARMRSVALCESGLRPHAKGGPYVGLFQFGAPLWRATPYGSFDRADPYASALAGAWAFGRGMASHWPVCGRR